MNVLPERVSKRVPTMYPPFTVPPVMYPPLMVPPERYPPAIVPPAIYKPVTVPAVTLSAEMLMISDEEAEPVVDDTSVLADV
jgi:hypothetical protein